MNCKFSRVEEGKYKCEVCGFEIKHNSSNINRVCGPRLREKAVSFVKLADQPNEKETKL